MESRFKSKLKFPDSTMLSGLQNAKYTKSKTYDQDTPDIDNNTNTNITKDDSIYSEGVTSGESNIDEDSDHEGYESLDEEYATPRGQYEEYSPRESDYATPRNRRVSNNARFADTHEVREFYKDKPIIPEESSCKYSIGDLVYYQGRIGRIVDECYTLKGLDDSRYHILFKNGSIEHHIAEKKLTPASQGGKTKKSYKKTKKSYKKTRKGYKKTRKGYKKGGKSKRRR